MKKTNLDFQNYITRYQDAVSSDNVIEQQVIRNDLLLKAKNNPYVLGKILAKLVVFQDDKFEENIMDIIMQHSFLEGYNYITTYIDVLDGKTEENKDPHTLECVEDFLCEKIIELSNQGDQEGATECAQMIISKILEPHGRIDKVKDLINQLK